jgi:hypothetical protein
MSEAHMSETIQTAGYRGLMLVANDRRWDFEIPDSCSKISIGGDVTSPFLRAITAAGDITTVRPTGSSSGQ